MAIAALLAVSCGRHVPPDVSGFRAAMRRSINLVRPESGDTARQLERLLAEAETATAGEAATPWWQGSVGRTEAAWARALHAAAVATREIRALRTRIEDPNHGLLRQVKDEVAQAQGELREASMGHTEIAATERARNRLALAERLIGLGAYSAAREELEAALVDVAAVHAAWSALHARFADPALRRYWHRLADETIEYSRISGEVVLIVDKLRRKVLVFRGGREEASFRADLGANGLRRKERAGDRATPEGRYHVVELKEGRHTRYYKALLINYPNDEDRMRFALGRTRGLIPFRAGIGSLIEIHGGGGEGRDWTDGCVALANKDMDRVYAVSRVGTPVTIVGTHGH